MLRQFAESRYWTPEQVFSIPVATFWLMFNLKTQRRPHNFGAIRDAWNLKFRIAKGLPPI